MKNNFWEEQQMPNIQDFHQRSVGDFGLPEWLKIACPFCKTQLPLRSIRSVGLRLNTRNMGDLVVEFACDCCGQMDTLYYRQVVSNMQDFCDLMHGDKAPQDQPIIEEEMYKQRYNNVAEKMAVAFNDLQRMHFNT